MAVDRKVVVRQAKGYMRDEQRNVDVVRAHMEIAYTAGRGG